MRERVAVSLLDPDLDCLVGATVPTSFVKFDSRYETWLLCARQQKEDIEQGEVVLLVGLIYGKKNMPKGPSFDNLWLGPYSNTEAPRPFVLLLVTVWVQVTSTGYCVVLCDPHLILSWVTTINRMEGTALIYR